ncbi:unnamed protein product [Mesocestoides corti]|uniref:Protein MCM10 homolog n=1 Tax=Mesocestoides corti TaxID=53468 RepID=A0A158QTF2_MESCO|nr:unnamed protein product [Mesocestoides corti]
MRTLGYPPGWLRKARVEQLPSFDGESGDTCNYEVRYNEDEIIEYPGFNVYSSKLRDNYHVLRCPSIQKCHLLENFIASLRGETAKSEESARRYKESLANKANRTLTNYEYLGLNDLEGERQRLLAEITALSNSDSSSISVFLSSQTDASTIIMVSDEEGEVSNDDVENRSTKRPSSEAMPGEDSVSPHLDRQEKDNKVDGGDSITERQLSPVLEEGTTIPFNIYLIKNATADSASPVNPANVSSTSDKRPDFEAFSSGIQPYEPYVNPPNAEGAYKRVRETLKRVKDIQSCSTAVESEGDEPALKSMRSRSPVSGDNCSQEKQSSPSSYAKNYSDVMLPERGHSFRQGERRLAYGCHQTHVFEDHYPIGIRATCGKRSRVPRHRAFAIATKRPFRRSVTRTANRAPCARGTLTRGKEWACAGRDMLAGDRRPMRVPASPRFLLVQVKVAEFGNSPPPPHLDWILSHLMASSSPAKLLPEPTGQSVSRLCSESGSQGQRAESGRCGGPQHAVNSLTPDEINEFLAHSDKEDDDEGSSADSSDWDDVKEEGEEEEEEENANYVKEVPLYTQQSIPPPLSSRQTFTDIGVAELFGPVRSNQEASDAQITANEDDDVLSYTDARRSDLNDYGLQIQESLSSEASDRHKRRVERDVERHILADKQTVDSISSDRLTEAQKKALKLCEAKRNAALTSAGGSQANDSSSKASDCFVATPTNIRVVRPQISSELWMTRTCNRRVFGLHQYVREVKAANGSNLQTEMTVLVGVIGTKVPPRRSRNNKIYSIWRLTDLASVGTGSTNGPNVSIFLFGAVHEKLWKEPEGTVIAVLKPKLLPSNENDASCNAATDLSITVDSAPFVMPLGVSPDFAVCAGTTKAGRPCTRIVNKNVCRYCDFHVKAAYYSASSSRPGFTSSSKSTSIKFSQQYFFSKKTRNISVRDSVIFPNSDSVSSRIIKRSECRYFLNKYPRISCLSENFLCRTLGISLHRLSGSSDEKEVMFIGTLAKRAFSEMKAAILSGSPSREQVTAEVAVAEQPPILRCFPNKLRTIRLIVPPPCLSIGIKTKVFLVIPKPFVTLFRANRLPVGRNSQEHVGVQFSGAKPLAIASRRPPQRVALSKAKLTSSGYVMESSSLTLSSSASGVSKSQLSKSENILASRLSRPSRGSLNLLRHLEALSDDKSKSNNSALRSRSLKTLLPSGSDGTFASFFADAKKKVQVSTVPFTSEKAAGPQLCRGIDPASENDNFIDLGPISTSNPTHTGALTVLPSINGARRRIEALVRSKGGVEALDRLERERTQKRLSEVVSRSASKRPRPSPLSQVLDTAPPPSGNVDPEETHRDEEKAASEKRRHANHELAQLVSQGSSHSDLAAADEVLAEKRLLSRLEARDSIEEHLLGQHEQECQVVTCLTSASNGFPRYVSANTCFFLSATTDHCVLGDFVAKRDIDWKSPPPLGDSLPAEIVKQEQAHLIATHSMRAREFFLQLPSCGESLYEKTGAISERRGPKLPGEKLLIRGLEEKYLG